MARIRFGLVLALLMGLVLQVGSAEAAKGKKRKHRPEVGVITAIDPASSDGAITMTAKIGGHKSKKNPTPSAAVDKKFTVTSATTIVKVTGKKKSATETPATLADLKTGERIKVTAASDGKASKVMFASAKKDKKKKKNK